jgi:hypothetical protein
MSKRPSLYNIGMVRDVYSSMTEGLKDLEEYVKRKTPILKTHVSIKTLDLLLRAIRLEAMINLTDYSATGSQPRDKTITEAFDLLEKLIGFEYNKKGSFTWQGAKDQIEDNVSFNKLRYRLEVVVSGRLEEMEYGIANWNAMRRFFYSQGVKQALWILLPDKAPDFYERLDKLFQEKSDPTQPEGRPYISQALIVSSEYMDEAIQDAIRQVFGTNEEGFVIR